MTYRYAVALASALVFASCSSSPDSSTTTPPPAPPPPPPGSPQTATLTIADFDSWCALSVTSPANTTLPNGPSSGSNTITEAVGTTITLHAEPNSGFTWPTTANGTAGWSGALDTGSSPLNKTVSVTLTGNKSVEACCPFPDNSGCT